MAPIDKVAFRNGSTVFHLWVYVVEQTSNIVPLNCEALGVYSMFGNSERSYLRILIGRANGNSCTCICFMCANV